jgi:hypothetical protein
MQSGDGQSPPGGGGSEQIREIQRRRRDTSRQRASIEAIISQRRDIDEEQEWPETDEEPSGPPPAKVYIVFRGTRWEDPSGELRESDTIAGVYANEQAARLHVTGLDQETSEDGEAWYQPYDVQG